MADMELRGEYGAPWQILSSGANIKLHRGNEPSYGALNMELHGGDGAPCWLWSSVRFRADEKLHAEGGLHCGYRPVDESQ